MKLTYNGIELDVEKAEIIAYSAERQDIIYDRISQSAEGMQLHFSSVERPDSEGRHRVRLTLRKRDEEIQQVQQYTTAQKKNP